MTRFSFFEARGTSFSFEKFDHKDSGAKADISGFITFCFEVQISHS
jgi:hypothetical protein